VIPVKLQLKDFMTYASPDGGPITFDFDGAVLWSLAGRNGAGKSAIFDAITWSLFDKHRGGARSRSAGAARRCLSL
jgi:DNA repair exonuclease SbcCD ATPase subunit